MACGIRMAEAGLSKPRYISQEEDIFAATERPRPHFALQLLARRLWNSIWG
jgi:hypothetical protein